MKKNKNEYLRHNNDLILHVTLQYYCLLLSLYIFKKKLINFYLDKTIFVNKHMGRWLDHVAFPI